MLVGCAAATAPSAEHITLAPLVLRADARGRVEVTDPAAMFAKATRLYGDGEYQPAARLFGRIAHLFPESRHAPHARFNAGLALVHLKRCKEAAPWLDAARRTLVDPSDQADATVQIALCDARAGRWGQVASALGPLLSARTLPPLALVETQTRYGVALYRLGKLALAERAFLKVLAAYRKHIDVPGLRRNPHVSRAQYLIGEIYRDLFRSVRFRLPVESMKRDLHDKSMFFLKAQAAFLRCVRFEHPAWSVAAGFQLGKLYQDMYEGMMAAEVPTTLDARDREVYYDELKKYIKPLVVRAIDIYERNLSMSSRMGGSAEWARKTARELKRMRGVLDKELGGRR